MHLLIGLGAGCFKREPKPDGMPTESDFIAAKSQFPYSAPIERAARISNESPRIRVGASKRDVLALIGPPDFSKNTFDVASGSSGSVWVYYLYKVEGPGQRFGKDKVVNVFFDLSDKVVWLHPENVPGVPEQGSPEK